MMTTLFPKTHRELIEKTLDEESTVNLLKDIRWKNGFICPKCNSLKVPNERGDLKFRCVNCGKNISSVSGTYLDKSKIPLPTLLELFWALTERRAGLNSRDISKEFGISANSGSQKLNLFRKIVSILNNKQLMGDPQLDSFQISEHTVYVLYNYTNDSIRLRSATLSDEFNFMQNFLPQGEYVITRYGVVDPYEDMSEFRFNQKEPFNKSRGYMENTIPYQGKNIGDLFRRWLFGTYHGSVNAGNIQNYLEEFSFKFNRRGLSQGDRFKEVIEFALKNKV